MDMSRYLDLFICETREHLAAIEDDLARLLESPGDEAILHELFRHAHSIKGMAASMGYQKIAALAHGVEDLFDALKARVLVFDAEMRSAAGRAFDQLGRMIERVDAGEDAGEDTDLVLEELERIRTAAGGTDPSGHRSGIAGDGQASETVRGLSIEVLFVAQAALSSARAAVALKCLAGFGRVLRCEPGLGALERGEFEGRLTAEIRTSEPEEVLRESLERIADVVSVRIDPVPEEEDGGSPGSASIEEVRPSGAPRVHRQGPSLRLPASSLDRFLDASLDLIVQRSRIEVRVRGRVNRETDLELERLHTLTKRLHAEVMALRMLPFETIANRFRRSIRELSASLEKTVTLRITGREVLLDRAVLEELIDPINHVLRNAVDHGVETPGERRASGKPEEASITIAVERAGDWVRVRIDDDGRGIDPERMKQKALEKGLVSPEALRSISDSEALLLATLPGLSTTNQVSEISGRGVGMDVVRTRVESMGGRLLLSSALGAGTTVEMRLPLTVVVVPAFLVVAAGRSWAVPVRSVDRAVQFLPDKVLRADARDYLITRSGRVPLVDLAAVLGLSNGARLYEGARHALLAREGDRSIAVAVERIIGRREIVVRPLRRPLEELRAFSGATLLEDGRIALILDLLNLSGV